MNDEERERESGRDGEKEKERKREKERRKRRGRASVRRETETCQKGHMQEEAEVPRRVCVCILIGKGGEWESRLNQ